MSPLKAPDVDLLFEAILTLKTREDCYAFFEDVCTIKEVQDMAQRFNTAILLRKGENYNTISREVGVSTATISRVNRCLQYGADGYSRALDRMGITKSGKDQ